jgi:uncharacterized membrane protein YqhA
MDIKLTLIEYILVGSLLVSILISGYLTFVRVVYGIEHITYDSWILGMNLAMLLTIHDAQMRKKK